MNLLGTAGFAYRLEGIQIKLVPKGGAAPGSTSNSFKQNIKYQTHIQNIGWQDYVNSGDSSGTTGQSLRLEGIRIRIDNSDIQGSIEYCTHVQNIGWQNYVSNNQMSGTQGRALRLEAIKIRLTGELANKYDIYYRVHCQNFGWMGWAKNDESAGSAGYAYRLEAIQIVLVNKGGTAPGSTQNAFSECVKPPTPAVTPAAPAATQTSSTPVVNNPVIYVLNPKTMIFHRSTCAAAKRMKESNKIYTSDSRDIIIQCNYRACKDCKP